MQLPRRIYDSAMEWAMKSDKSQFWRGHRRMGVKVEPLKDGVVAARKVGKGFLRSSTPKSEE